VIDPANEEVRISYSPAKVFVLSKNNILDGGVVLPQFRLDLKDLFID
jgi:hypothetical protein